MRKVRESDEFQTYLDFLVTWNCLHPANANKSGHIRRAGASPGTGHRFAASVFTPPCGTGKLSGPVRGHRRMVPTAGGRKSVSGR